MSQAIASLLGKLLPPLIGEQCHLHSYSLELSVVRAQMLRGKMISGSRCAINEVLV
jgi:hypothetical protein